MPAAILLSPCVGGVAANAVGAAHVFVDGVQRKAISTADDLDDLLRGEGEHRIERRQVESFVEFQAGVELVAVLAPRHPTEHDCLPWTPRSLSLEPFQNARSDQHRNAPRVLAGEEADPTFHQVEVAQERVDNRHDESAVLQFLQVLKIAGKLKAVVRIQAYRFLGFHGLVEHRGHGEAVFAG